MLGVDNCLESLWSILDSEAVHCQSIDGPARQRPQKRFCAGHLLVYGQSLFVHMPMLASTKALFRICKLYTYCNAEQNECDNFKDGCTTKRAQLAALAACLIV